MKIRCFIALNIPNEIKGYILEEIESVDPLRKLRWEKSSKFHLTLKFLGDVEEDKIEQIKNVLENFVSGKNPVGLTLEKFGTFYRDKKLSVLWAGFKRSEQLSGYQSELDGMLKGIGFETERRKFLPHLTLYRVKQNSDTKILKRFENHKIKSVNFVADEILLLKSILKPSGSVYKILDKYYLKGK